MGKYLRLQVFLTILFSAAIILSNDASAAWTQPKGHSYNQISFSHYVTKDLDEGPIIEQDVVHISHRDSVEDMVRIGRDLEKVVLARAIWHQLNHDVLVYKNRTVVFD